MRPGRAILATLTLSALAGCAADNSRPSDILNACAIFEDRPHWAEAVRKAERKWGAPAEVQLAIIYRESSFREDAQPKMEHFMGVIPVGRASSAYGFSQAIDGTWDWYRKETGNSGADRDDFADATDFIGWYMARTQRVNGVPMDDAYNQYLAYHEGHAGYRRQSWRSKSWLQRAAGQVRILADAYARQLQSCGGRYAGGDPAPGAGPPTETTG